MSKQTPLRYMFSYGAIAGTMIIASITASIAFKAFSHFQSEWFGYLVMLAALSLVFVGVKRYRDIEGGGTIRFWPALGIGLGIAIVAGLFYVAGWEAYLATTEGNFMENYTAKMIADMRSAGASAAEIARTQAQLAPYAEMYRHPLTRMLITFSEIAPVGLLVALLSAAVLRNPRMLPSRRT